MSKGIRRKLLHIFICLLAAWTICETGMNLVAWRSAREMSRIHDNLNILPTPLKDTRTLTPEGVRLQKFGYSIQVPWNRVATDRTVKSIAAIGFEDGTGVLIFDPASEPSMIRMIRGRTVREQSTMKNMLGTLALNSNYEFSYAAARCVPADVTLWTGRNNNVRNIIFLTNKALSLGNAKAIHPLENSLVKGFQYGDPEQPPYFVDLELYDSADRHYKILISGKRQGRPPMLQSQLNGVIASFRPIEQAQ